MIENVWLRGCDDISGAMALRERIFGSGEDAGDAFALHLVVLADGVPVGVGRISVGEDYKFHIERCGVLPEYRGQGLGDLTAKLLIHKVMKHAGEVFVDCPAGLEGFFRRYGFTVAEAGTDAVRMRLLRDEVKYPSRCGGSA